MADIPEVFNEASCHLVEGGIRRATKTKNEFWLSNPALLVAGLRVGDCHRQSRSNPTFMMDPTTSH